jgi:hypothetical protein
MEVNHVKLKRWRLPSPWLNSLKESRQARLTERREPLHARVISRGGFFYGIRLWLGETIVAALLGFRPGPTRFSVEQHVGLLTVYWVYTFTTTAVTRLLYRLLSPEDWE